MTGTENVNLTDTTGKYEMRVLTEFCCYFIVVCACVCVSAGCLMPAHSTVAALMSSARSHGRHRCLCSALTFTLPHPLCSRPSMNSQRCAPVSVCLKKQTYSRENLNLFSSVCACAEERNNAYMQQKARSSADGTQVFWLEAFICHGVRPPVRSFLNTGNVFVQ